jgi:hypothetical protein
LLAYFSFIPHEIIQNTLGQTTQSAQSITHHPMRRHLKSQFQMFRQERLNEVIATDTYFESEKSIEEYYSEQVFFGMTSKILHVAEMKTECEYPNEKVDFIRQHGIPSALRHNNSKLDMSQHFQQIYRDFFIMD